MYLQVEIIIITNKIEVVQSAKKKDKDKYLSYHKQQNIIHT